MVELFTAECLTRSPKQSASVLPVARQQLPTPAALDELTECASLEPHGRDLELTKMPAAAPALRINVMPTGIKQSIRSQAARPKATQLTDTASRQNMTQGFSASPIVHDSNEKHLLDRTLVLLRLNHLPNKSSVKTIGITPTSLH